MASPLPKFKSNQDLMDEETPSVGEPQLKVIQGPGTGTSDSIPTELPERGFVITAAAMQMFGPDFFKRLIDAVPTEPSGEEMGEAQPVDVKVSDGEGYIPPEVVEFYGPDFFEKVNATATSGGAEEPMEGEESEGPKVGDEEEVKGFARGGSILDDEKTALVGGDNPQARADLVNNVAQGVGAVAQGSENLMRGAGNLVDSVGTGFSKLGNALNPIDAAQGIAKNVGNLVAGSDNIERINANPAVGQFKSNLDAAGSAAWEGAKERATMGNGLVGLAAAPINAIQKGMQAFSDNDQYKKTQAAEAARNDPNSPSYKYEPENQPVLQDVVKQRQAQVGANPQQTQVQSEAQKKPAVGAGAKQTDQGIDVGQTTASVLSNKSAVQQPPPANRGIATGALNQVAKDYQVGRANKPWPATPQFPGDDRPTALDNQPYIVNTGDKVDGVGQTQLNDNVVNLSGTPNWNEPNPTAGRNPARKIQPWYTEQDYRTAAYNTGDGAQYDAAQAAQQNAKTNAQEVGYNNANKTRELDQYAQGLRGKQNDNSDDGEVVTNSDGSEETKAHQKKRVAQQEFEQSILDGNTPFNWEDENHKRVYKRVLGTPKDQRTAKDIAFIQRLRQQGN